jgi:hypothetical protein
MEFCKWVIALQLPNFKPIIQCELIDCFSKNGFHRVCNMIELSSIGQIYLWEVQSKNKVVKISIKKIFD